MSTKKSHYTRSTSRPSYMLSLFLFLGAAAGIAAGVLSINTIGSTEGTALIAIGVLLFVWGFLRNKRLNIRANIEAGTEIILDLEEDYPVIVEKLDKNRIVALADHLLGSREPQPFTIRFTDADGKEDFGNIVSSKQDGFILVDSSGNEVGRNN